MNKNRREEIEKTVKSCEIVYMSGKLFDADSNKLMIEELVDKVEELFKPKMTAKEHNFKEEVLMEGSHGNIIVSTFDGLQIANLLEVIEQPTNGLLYDLNRDAGTILTCLNDPKWVNDYACMQVIVALKNKIEVLEKQIKNK